MKKTSTRYQTIRAAESAADMFAPGTSPPNVVHTLGREIVAGIYPEGTVLPSEAVMLDKFGISRTALREAYSKLTAKGLVRARPRVGTTVRSRSNWNTLDHDVLAWHLQTVPADEIANDLYVLRRMIEPSAAELAAQVRTDDDVKNIYDALARMKENATEEAGLVEADFSFHVAILTATHNPFVNAFSALIRAAMLSVFEMSWRGAEVIKDHRLMQHEMVANAIRDQHPQEAHKLMKELLDESIEDARSVVRQ